MLCIARRIYIAAFCALFTWASITKHSHCTILHFFFFLVRHHTHLSQTNQLERNSVELELVLLRSAGLLRSCWCSCSGSSLSCCRGLERAPLWLHRCTAKADEACLYGCGRRSGCGLPMRQKSERTMSNANICAAPAALAERRAALEQSMRGAAAAARRRATAEEVRRPWEARTSGAKLQGAVCERR